MSSEDTTQRLPRAVVDLEERVNALEKKFDERGYDTRPLFQAHDNQIKHLQAQIQRLEESLTKNPTGELSYQEWAYFTETGDGPFCRHCFDDKHKRCRLEQLEDPGHHFCTICKNYHYEPGFLPKSQVVSTLDSPFDID